jgi:hypothetical protein
LAANIAAHGVCEVRRLHLLFSFLLGRGEPVITMLLLFLALFLQHLVNPLQFLQFLLIEVHSVAATLKAVLVQDGLILTVRLFREGVVAGVEADLLKEGRRPVARLLVLLILIVDIDHVLDARDDLLVLHRRVLSARLLVDYELVAR